jgi:molybdate transport system substrate-binding protein
MIRLLVPIFLLASIARGQAVSVSAAISLKEALVEIRDAYGAGGGGKVTFNFGASGHLADQIENGAMVDVFVSAANKQMDDVAKAGLLRDGSRRVVARNRLVLVVPADSADAPKDFKELAAPRFKRIAVGRPKVVPAGDYAADVFKALGLADAISGRLVFGANVRQVLDYVERGEVNAGVVYRTDALEAGKTVRIVAIADAKLHTPIEYPGAILKSSPNIAPAQRFLDFLSSDKARAILAAHGFEDPVQAAQAKDKSSPAARSK